MKTSDPIRSRVLPLIAWVMLGAPTPGPVSAAGTQDREAAVRPWSVSLQTRYFFWVIRLRSSCQKHRQFPQ